MRPHLFPELLLRELDDEDNASLDRPLAEADEKVGSLSVTRSFYSWQVGERLPAKSTVMKYAAPPCFSMWAVSYTHLTLPTILLV